MQSGSRQGCREAGCDLAFRANSHCSTRTEGLLIIHVTHPLVTLISSPEWFGRRQNYPLLYNTRYDWPIPNPTPNQHKVMTDVIHCALLRVCKPTTAMALPVMCRHRRAVLSLISTIHILLKLNIYFFLDFNAASFLNLHTNICITILKWARIGTVGRGTELQAGRTQVRFPLILMEFFIDLILSAALWPRGPLSL